jgi:tetratricopeptide (TPR) repeat protein
VGRALEQLCAGETDEVCAQLAWHYDQAGQDDKAVEYLLKAGERAALQGGMQEARRFFDRALELLPPTDRERRWRALWGREGVLQVLGEMEAWHADNAALIALAEEMDDPACMAEAYYREAFVTSWTFRQSLEVLPWADKALVSAQCAGDVKTQIKARTLQVTHPMAWFDPERARAPLEQLLTQAQELGDDETVLHVIIGLQRVCLETDDLERAVELNQQAIAVARRRGDRSSEGDWLDKLSGCYESMGLYQLQRSVLEQKLVVDDSIGNRIGRAWSLLFIWYVDSMQGSGAGEQNLDEVLSEIEANPLWGGRGVVLHFRAGELERSGDYAGAQRRYRQLFDRWMAEPFETNVQTARAGLARCALAMGQLDDARELAAELWAYLQAHGAAGMDYPGLAYKTCADVFAALGDAETSRAVCDAGHRDLTRLADRIHNPEWREAFLQNVPGNRALAEMWERIHPPG